MIFKTKGEIREKWIWVVIENRTWYSDLSRLASHSEFSMRSSQLLLRTWTAHEMSELGMIFSSFGPEEPEDMSRLIISCKWQLRWQISERQVCLHHSLVSIVVHPSLILKLSNLIFLFLTTSSFMINWLLRKLLFIKIIRDWSSINRTSIQGFDTPKYPYQDPKQFLN